EVLFQKSVLSNTYNPGIGTATLSFLQQVAHSVLRDSLMVWNIGKNMPWADFTPTLTSGSTYQFGSASVAMANAWNFGDGVTAQGASVAHTYTQSGTYTVSHVAMNNCNKDSVTKVLNVTAVNTTGLKQNLKPTLFTFYPNPANDKLYLQLPIEIEQRALKTEIFDSNGKRVFEADYKPMLQIRSLNQGIYYGRISNNYYTATFKFVKIED
ncbi:MAG: T9SS type A sorting domain-containing protein, partial [Bacteroidia bacterium]|nr:T9SS type A sorting domain-containing protein [Bacteroidia bacterium]